MRQITKDSVNAFWNGDTFKRGNTQVGRNEAGENCLKLHNTIIAKKLSSGKLRLNTDRWLTTTTKERLNGVLDKLGMKIYQKKGVWHVWNMGNDESIEFIDGMEFRL